MTEAYDTPPDRRIRTGLSPVPSRRRCYAITESDQFFDLKIESKVLSSRHASPHHAQGTVFVGRHLRSVKHHALRQTLKAARGARHSNKYVSQRQLAAYVGLRQSAYGMMETGERRVEVLDFIDIGDAHSSDRLALFRALIALCPRRIQPIRKTAGWRAEAAVKAAKRRKTKQTQQGPAKKKRSAKARRAGGPRRRES